MDLGTCNRITKYLGRSFATTQPPLQYATPEACRLKSHWCNYSSHCLPCPNIRVSVHSQCFAYCPFAWMCRVDQKAAVKFTCSNFKQNILRCGGLRLFTLININKRKSIFRLFLFCVVLVLRNRFWQFTTVNLSVHLTLHSCFDRYYLWTGVKPPRHTHPLLCKQGSQQDKVCLSQLSWTFPPQDSKVIPRGFDRSNRLPLYHPTAPPAPDK